MFYICIFILCQLELLLLLLKIDVYYLDLQGVFLKNFGCLVTLLKLLLQQVNCWVFENQVDNYEFKDIFFVECYRDGLFALIVLCFCGTVFVSYESLYFFKKTRNYYELCLLWF